MDAGTTSGGASASASVTAGGTGAVVVTAVCFILATVAWGTVFYGHSVYMNALMRGHGWSTATVSSGIFVFWLAALPGTLMVGVLVDRFGPPLVVAVGGLCVGGGLVGLGLLDETWQMYIAFASLGFGYPALAAAVISATLVPWFERGFAVALGIALTGASVGGAVIPVLVVQGVAKFGFGMTMSLVGAGVLAVVSVMVVVLAVVGQPGRGAAASGGETGFSMANRLASPLFWVIAIATALGLGGQVGFLGHQVPIMMQHVDEITASFFVTVVAVAAAVGRLLIGGLSRFLASRSLAALSYAVYGCGISVLALADGVSSLLAGCALAGLFVGAIVMLPPILVREIFGPEGYGRTTAMVNLVMYAFVGVATWGAGIIKDATGTYEASLWMLVVMEALAVVLVLALPGRGRRN